MLGGKMSVFRLSALLASVLDLFSCWLCSCYRKMAPGVPGLPSTGFTNLGEKAFFLLVPATISDRLEFIAHPLTNHSQQGI